MFNYRLSSIDKKFYDYRYGFNGYENDDEVKGNGSSLSTTFRSYDPRLGRWLSTDPITHAMYSPYSAFDNNPIYYKDPSGADSETTQHKPPRRNKNFTGTRGLFKFLGIDRGKYTGKLTRNGKKFYKVRDVEIIEREKVGTEIEKHSSTKNYPVANGDLIDLNNDRIEEGSLLLMSRRSGTLIVSSDSKGGSNVEIGVYNERTNSLSRTIYSGVVPGGGEASINYTLGANEQIMKINKPTLSLATTTTFSERLIITTTTKKVTYRDVAPVKKKKRNFRIMRL